MKPDSAVIVTCHGIVRISEKTLADYGIRRGVREFLPRKRMRQLERNVMAIAEHRWIKGDVLEAA